VTSRPIVATLVAATIATVYPGFLIGALSVQVSDEFDVGAATYGWALGGFFLAATVTSVFGGRLVQRIGPRRQITVALGATMLAQIGIVLFSSSFGVVVGLLAVCGVVNAANQAAINLALTQAQLPRLGLAIALKQSGMPSASLLSGLAVPTLALTLGWRAAYLVGAVIAAAALVLVVRWIAPVPPSERLKVKPVSSPRALRWAFVAGAFLAFSAGALNAWIVASGVDAGLSEGAAGVMLSLGAACGIAVRLSVGARVDAMRSRPFMAAAGASAVGAVGLLALGGGRGAMLHVGATLVAFAFGWVWPVFTNFGVMRTNGRASGAASGVTQMGVYLGVFVAPLATGWLIDHYGFATMWTVTAVAGLCGAASLLRIADEF